MTPEISRQARTESKPGLGGAGAGVPVAVRSALFILALGLQLAAVAGVEPAVLEERVGPAAVQLQRQQLVEVLREKMPGHEEAKAEKVADEFSEHLRVSSPVAAETLRQGKMDEEELRARVDVFLREHPALTGLSIPMASAGTPKERVETVLGRLSQAPAGGAERAALADKFLARLREKNRTASEALQSGGMGDDELLSRVEVFVTDLAAGPATQAADAKAAAASALVDAYLKANYGNPGERAVSLALRGTVRADGVDHSFAIFRKRPSRLRMHLMKDGLVVGIVAYDGKTAWRQEAGRAPVELRGNDLNAVVRTSRYDDPLADCADRGAELRVEEQTEKLIRLQVREKDGSELLVDLEPQTYRETSQRSRQSGETEWTEIRFSDYRKTGPLNLARTQEEWKGGKLVSTTRISEVATDPGLLDSFFAVPAYSMLGYMDYMAGLSLLRERQQLQEPVKKEAAR